MTKKEIYEQVVRLSNELAQTKIPERIFSAANEGDSIKIDIIISAFPEYYPDLYQRIVTFGKEFNQLVGDSPEDIKRLHETIEDCGFLMDSLLRGRVIEKISEALDAEDSSKLQEVMTSIKKSYPICNTKLAKFQKEYIEYSHFTGCEGQIFGIEEDVENDVFVFDTNVIDALSFYVLVILAKISDNYLFYDKTVTDNIGEYTSPANDQFVSAIEEATNEYFADFVLNYNISDWIEATKYPHQDGRTVGSILVSVIFGIFNE